MKSQKIGFIGAGKVGTALAVRLFKSGYSVIAVTDANLRATEKLAELVSGCQVFKNAQQVADSVELIFITTPDDYIHKVCSELTWYPDQNVVHCSGAASIDILEPAKKVGALVGSFHPCQAFASVDEAIKNIPGSTFSIEAQPPLLDLLKEMASSMGCDWIVLNPRDKALYHAATVFVSNYSVALLKIATDLFQSFDVSLTQATKVLMPLIQGNLNNMRNLGLPNCLTGPIARGDIGTIKKHIKILQEKDSTVLKLYAELGLQIVPVALAKGTIDDRVGNNLKALLKKAVDIGS